MSSHRYLQRARRISHSLLTVSVILGLTLILASAMPWLSGRDVALSILRARDPERTPDPETLDSIREEMNVPDTWFQGMMHWIGDILRGETGRSWVDPGRSVGDIVFHALGPSLWIAGVSTVVMVLISLSVILPFVFRLARGQRTNTSLVSAFSALGAAVPEFLLAVILVSIVAVRFQWLPAAGWYGIDHAILPIASVALPGAALLTRVTLLQLHSLSTEGWVDSWRLNGIEPKRIRRSIQKALVFQMFPQYLLFFVGSIAATVWVEDIFNIPGIGRVAVQAAKDQDIPVIQFLLILIVGMGVFSGMFIYLMSPGGSREHIRIREGTVQGSLGREATVILWGSILIFVVVILAGWFRPRSSVDLHYRLASPTMERPMGSDHIGRDVLALLAEGLGQTVGLALVATMICIFLGILLGSVGGTQIISLSHALNAAPAVVIGIVLVAIWGASSFTAVIAVCCVGWIPLAIHGNTVAEQIKSTGYYQWSRCAGASRRQLLTRHIVPAVTPVVIRHGMARLPHATMAVAGLGFLGLGPDVDSAQWGVILAQSLPYVSRAPWVAFSLMIMMVLMGIIAVLLSDASSSPESNS